MPTEFASSAPLDVEGVPLRSLPRPSRLRAPLHTRPGAREPLASLGIETVGDLLAHLPRDRREARTVATLVPTG